ARSSYLQARVGWMQLQRLVWFDRSDERSRCGEPRLFRGAQDPWRDEPAQHSGAGSRLAGEGHERDSHLFELKRFRVDAAAYLGWQAGCQKSSQRRLVSDHGNDSLLPFRQYREGRIRGLIG